MKKFNIFLVLDGRATGVNGSSIWIKNFYDTLSNWGHDVSLVSVGDFFTSKGLNISSAKAKEILSSELPKEFKKQNEQKKFDIFLSYLHNGQIFPSAFHEIKKEGVFTVNYTTNYHQFPMYEDIAKIVDMNIYASKIAHQGFDKANAKSYYMPFAANPKYYKPLKTKENKAVFIGSTYGVRPYYLWRVLQNEIDLQLYGPGWKNPSLKKRIKNQYYNYRSVFAKTDERLDLLNKQTNFEIIKKLNNNFDKNMHQELSDEDYFKKIASASISVNINESRFNHDFLNHRVLLGCNLRDFENTMSGTLSITQYSEELSNFFEDGKEVVSFKNEYELVDKLQYYIKNDSEAQKIALAGYHRAVSEHTWGKRFNDFFNNINI